MADRTKQYFVNAIQVHYVNYAETCELICPLLTTHRCCHKTRHAIRNFIATQFTLITSPITSIF